MRREKLDEPLLKAMRSGDLSSVRTVVVFARKGALADVRSAARALGAMERHVLERISAVAVTIDLQRLNDLTDDPNVLAVHEDQAFPMRGKSAAAKDSSAESWPAFASKVFPNSRSMTPDEAQSYDAIVLGRGTPTGRRRASNGRPHRGE